VELITLGSILVDEFIVQGKTGHLPDDSTLSFLVGDDAVFSFDVVQTVFAKFQIKLVQARNTPGFKSDDVDTLERILKAAIEKKMWFEHYCGLKV
jgi:hypothetical protein